MGIAGGSENGAATVENGTAVPPKRSELAVPLLDKRPKDLKTGTETDTCPPLSTAALLPKAERWKQPKRPLLSDRVDKV